MIICIKSLLPPAESASICQVLRQSDFIDGKHTAGWHAQLVKNNQQANPHQHAVEAVAASVSKALMANELFRLAARPKQVSPLIFSRYSEGMHYGSHVDDAFMNGLRTDLSFTLFLGNPCSYEGGALVLDLPHGEQSFKLDAGDLVLYPSTTLHYVEPVTLGERLVCVGWAQSLVRRSDQRELLFDLETAQLTLFRKEGKSSTFDLLSKSISNLLRMWAE